MIENRTFDQSNEIGMAAAAEIAGLKRFSCELKGPMQRDTGSLGHANCNSRLMGYSQEKEAKKERIYSAL